MLTIGLFVLSLLASGQAAAGELQQFPGTRSAYVQGTLNLAAGERATLRRNEDGSYTLEKVERIGVEDVIPPRSGSPAEAQLNGAPAGALRFGLHARRDVGSLLKVENGAGDGLKYAGFIVRVSGGRPGGPTPTSVCTVPAGLVSFEHWPEPVTQIVIGSLERSDDRLPTCPPHAGSQQTADAAAGTEQPAGGEALAGLAAEGERLGRLSTLFALCAPYYAVDTEVGGRAADDFERRSAEAGWTRQQRQAAYDSGRARERAEVGLIMDTSGLAPGEARRLYAQMLSRLKTRCHQLAQELPGSVSDLDGGDRKLDTELRRVR